MRKITIAVIVSLLFSANSFAADSEISLSDKQAKPNGLTALAFEPLADNATYNLSCVVRSDRFSGRGHSDLRFITQGNIKVIFNRIDTSANNGNATIQFPLNSMKVDSVTKQDAVLIQNLDKYDTIYIERCIAKQV